MKKIEDIYKNYNEKIMPSQKLDEKILNETVYKKSYNSLWKKNFITLSILLIVSIATIGIVYADEIIEKVKSILVTTVIDFDDKKGGYDIYLTELKVKNQKDLNVDAKFSNVIFPVVGNEQVISFKELKENLNIDILTPNIFEKQKARIIKLEKNNDKISHGNFTFDDVYKSKKGKKGKISMSIEFITKYYEEDYFMLTLGYTRNPNKKTYKAIELNEKLNVEIYFWGTRAISNEDEEIGTLIASFTYDDIAYTFTGYDISKNDMLNLLNSLDYYN